ncbi:helix-turn-helix transcriptional regulator [Flexivirga meconopsidis]|uniref:helix-turn-helix transcriptional regulator n=1 Tax=Flexivirga meconopsidis TaxID=2977121 RepID=UPI00224005A4|nr:helix-turn-helix transcriptional regulator [Flexivirga meconopsidis]
MGLKTSELGLFLRAKRGAVSPEEHSLVSTGARRVPGLRRAEVAVVAGVSVDYYTKLEQGRELNPSPQVLRALAETLRLDEEETAHLFVLSGASVRQSQDVRSTSLAPSLRVLLDGWSEHPAMVVTRGLDVLARNPLAEALYSGFEITDNIARMTFLDPAAPEFYVEYDRACETSVANLRKAAGQHPHDSRVRGVIDELIDQSQAFEQLWSRQSVRGKSQDVKTLQHPQVGRLVLSYETFSVNSAPGQELVVYSAESRSSSATRLALLRSIPQAGPGSQ